MHVGLVFLFVRLEFWAMFVYSMEHGGICFFFCLFFVAYKSFLSHAGVLLRVCAGYMLPM